MSPALNYFIRSACLYVFVSEFDCCMRTCSRADGEHGSALFSEHHASTWLAVRTFPKLFGSDQFHEVGARRDLSANGIATIPQVHVVARLANAVMDHVDAPSHHVVRGPIQGRQGTD